MIFLAYLGVALPLIIAYFLLVWFVIPCFISSVCSNQLNFLDFSSHGGYWKLIFRIHKWVIGGGLAIATVFCLFSILWYFVGTYYVWGLRFLSAS